MTRIRWIGAMAGGSLLLLVVLGSGWAQEQMAREKKTEVGSGFGFNVSRSPIDISSDTVEGDQKQNKVTFKGNVVARQEGTTIYCNLLVITYDPEMKKLKEIAALGNVKIVNVEKRATSQKVTFHQDENRVVLDGDTVIREGDNVIRAERVTYYVDEERTVVEGGKGGRVNTKITPPQKEGEAKN